MTHNKDCTVKTSKRDVITDIAQRIYNSGSRKVPQDIRDELVDMGYEFKGSGASRSTWRVPQDDTGNRPTVQADCVVKFATAGKGRISDGRRQNGKEIANFRQLPDRLVDPEHGVPLFVPLRDWGGNNLWISAPEVDASRGAGNPSEVQRKLDARGWKCEDVRRVNVGAMHGESVILDYGMECEAVDPSMGIAAELVDQLDEFGASKVEADRVDTDTAVVEFMAPSGTPGAESVRSKSSMHVTLNGIEGVTLMELAFGSWDVEKSAQIERKVRRGSDMVVQEWNEAWQNADMSWDDITTNGLMDVYFEVGVHHGKNVEPTIAKNMYADAVDLVMRHIPDQRTPEVARKQVQRAIENQLP